jgi:putrescine:ornithine antiporter
MAEAQKKMSVMQLTFIVTVNMMGSGIIMLPANMAQVGAISLLSWLVTAVGSMAIAYGFAQAGIFNQRPGGMAAYAEDAYGKAGYFQVFFLYFLSVAIANVAVASSALGYLVPFFPALGSTQVTTTIGIIALLWITTAANFGGPKLTGRIGSITVWGVILPVGFISIAGWFWFSADTFAAAWNPNGVSLVEGMGSSIALTLWAFLGMESAAQNASAVENPKRDVPLACLFGTLGAAAIYILSTAVIQGIVPNAQLAESTGPFGLAFTQMFNPMVGSIVMGLAAMACIGSLLGWQFTLAQTAKDAADNGMFPAIFAKANALGAPVVGMLIMGVVQSLMALVDDVAQPERTVRGAGQPGRGHQRRSLHHRPVRTAGDHAAGRGVRVDRDTQPVGGNYRDPVQHLCLVCLRRRSRDGRHPRDGNRLAGLGLHLAALQRAADGNPERLRGE